MNESCMRHLARIAVLSAVLAVVAVPVSASAGIHPHAPTAADGITLRIGAVCQVSSHTLTRTGNEIRVALGGGPCGTPPVWYAYEVPLGKLAAGSYRAIVTGDPVDDAFDFVVRESDPDVVIRPSVVFTNAPGQEVWLEARHGFTFCAGIGNCTPAVEIGGVAIPVQATNAGTTLLKIDVPANLTAGWKDLRVTTQEGTFVFPVALYVHAPGSQPDRQAFERILFPVLFSSDGVNGSRWRSEAVVFNPTRYTIRNASEVAPGTGTLAPRSRKAFGGEGHPRGATLFVPRAEADELAFSLRVRDVSREADGLGTEVPVVRERDMSIEPAVPLLNAQFTGVIRRNADVALLDVPRDPRYRTKVRIYALPVDDARNDTATTLRLEDASGTVIAEEVFLEPAPGCGGLECPLYAEYDLPAGAAGERSDVFVRLHEGWLTWAFASVTNNETQQVTIVSPNGRGGSRWE